MVNIGMSPSGEDEIALASAESLSMMNRVLLWRSQKDLFAEPGLKQMIIDLAKMYGLEEDKDHEVEDLVKAAASQALILSYRVCKAFGIDEELFREKVEDVIEVENDMFYDLDKH